MSITLVAVDFKHARRVRLVFDNTLDTGAFGVSTTLYTVESQESGTASPSVKAALIVTDSPKVVELALSADLVDGVTYRIYAEAVPATDASVTPDDTSLLARYGAPRPKVNVEPKVSRRDLLLYGVDLNWENNDFAETANGDLGRVSGIPNVTKALYNGMFTEGLPYDSSWGAKVREYVDSPSPAAGTLRGALLAQVRLDPRVESAKVTFSFETDASYFTIVPTLLTGTVLPSLVYKVPHAS